MASDQCIERRHRHPDGAAPGLALPAGRPAGSPDERVRGGRYRGIGDIEPKVECPDAAADGGRLDRHRAVAAVEHPQSLDQRRLRFERDHPRAQPAKAGDAVSDMRADIEGKPARLQEWPVQPVHGRTTPAVPVIDAERSDDAAKRSPGIAYGHIPEGNIAHGQAAGRCAVSSMAGSATAASSASGAVSSGSRHKPSRRSARPMAGEAVITARGIDNNGPPATNRA